GRGRGEATTVLDEQRIFEPQDTAPAVVVYERRSGLTDADRAKAAADARTFSGYTTISGQVVGPVPGTRDGATPQALETVVPISFGTGGWKAIGDTVDQIRAVVQAGSPDGLNVYVTGPGAVDADQGKAFSGVAGPCLYPPP